MEQDNKSSIFAFLVALPLILCLLVSSASGAKLYVGGEKYEKEGVDISNLAFGQLDFRSSLLP